MLIDSIRRSISPINCLLCQQKSLSNQWFCTDCNQILPRIEIACPVCANAVVNRGICGYCLSHRRYFNNVNVPFLYKQPVNRLIYQFKYKHHFYAYRPLVVELIDLIKKSKQALPELIIPVPLHPRRLRKRGFNQSSLIAKSLAKTLNIDYDNKSLIRHKFTRPQVELTGKEREKAIRNAFSVISEVKAKHVALVDDVITTSNTVNQAAKALKPSGVEKISVWALARNT